MLNLQTFTVVYFFGRKPALSQNTKRLKTLFVVRCKSL
jgi:hypothetical protein